MKLKQKLSILSLLTGLISLINSCSQHKPSIQLLHTTELNFPSASAIEFYQNKLYVFGDDASQLLVLSTGHQLIDSIPIWQPTEGRITKANKHDIESAFIKSDSNKMFVYGVGSMSSKNRWRVIKYNPQTGITTSTSFFDQGYRFPSISEINIEGSCAMKDAILFSNRGNLNNPTNHLLIWDQSNSLISKLFVLPKGNVFAGVSGLYYIAEKDALLFTVSEEETSNAIIDGAIGDSYLGLIRKFSQKLADSSVKPDIYLRLADFDQSFKKQKIESVCVEAITNSFIKLHLVADNDDGRSRLYALKLSTDW